MSTTTTQSHRRTRLAQVVDDFYIDRDPEACEVDVSHVLDDGRPCPRFLTVTVRDEDQIAYGTLHETRHAAVDRASLYAEDGLCREFPWSIVDLDGYAFVEARPDWDALPWSAVDPTVVPATTGDPILRTEG